MNLNNRLQTYIKKRKNQKQKSSITFILSILVVLSVISSLVMPAISMTIEEFSTNYSVQNETTQILSSETTTTTPSDLANSINLTPSETNDTFKLTVEDKGGNLIYNSNTTDGSVEKPAYSATGNEVYLTIAIEYFKADVKDELGALIDTTNPHLYVDISTVFGADTTIGILDESSRTGDVDDPAYINYLVSNGSGEAAAGTYEITSDGFIKITLTQDYIMYVLGDGGDGSLLGTLEFSGTLNRSADENGDQTFNIGGQEVTVTFEDRYPDVTKKTGTVNETDGTITWRVEINNQYNIDLGEYKLTDSMLEGASNITVTPSGVGSYDSTEKAVVFESEASKNATTIVVEYTTEITDTQLADGYADNTATLSKGDWKDEESSKPSLNYKTPVYVNKYGVQDYSSGTYGNKINWTIEITSQYGVSLDGYIIQDKLVDNSGNPVDLSQTAVTVSPSGTLTPNSDGNWVLSGTNGANKITLTYETQAESGQSYTNNVKVYYPSSSTPTGGEANPTVEYKKEIDLIGLDKRGSVNPTEGTITWTITISNNNKLDISDYTLSDEMMASLKEGTLTITPAGVGSLSEDGKTIEFASNTTAQSITITYKTDITPEELYNESASNTAKLSDGTQSKEDPETVQLTNTAVTVNKNGTQDYANGTYGNKINWTITLTSNYGTSLDGYIIEDKITTTDGQTIDLTNAVISVSPSGTVTKNSDGKWVLSGTNNVNQVRLTYQTDAVAGKTYNNTASVYYPDDGDSSTELKPVDGGTHTAPSVSYVDESSLIGFTKNGYWEADANRIKWVVKINPQGGMSLNGYSISDTEFPDTVDGFFFNTNLGEGSYTYNSETKTLTFHVVDGYPLTSSVEFYYYKEYYVENVTGTVTATNSISANNQTVTATVNITPRNELTKTVVNSSHSSNKYEWIQNNGKLERIINWKAEITLDASFAGLTYSDTLSAADSDDTHIITAEQANAALVYARQYSGDDETRLVLGTDYTITRADDGTNFKIIFTEDVADKYNYVTITYSTTAVAAAPSSSDDYNTDHQFKNSASFNNKSSTDTYTINRDDPTEYEELNLTVKKNWNNIPSNLTLPENVTTRILYCTNTDSEWRVLKGTDGNYLFSGDDGYSSASDYVVTISSSDSWSKTVSKLPKKITVANADGSKGATTNYYYKIEEITPSGHTVVNGMYEVDGGAFKVEYNNNNKIGTTAEVTVNNTYYADKEVVPKKLWKGDEGTGTHVTSITFQLKYSLNGSTWYPVKTDTEGNYIFDADGTTEGAAIAEQDITASNAVDSTTWQGAAWKNLPTLLDINGTATYLQYKVFETKVDGAEISNNQFVVYGDDTIAEGYYTVSENGETVENFFHKTTQYSLSAEKVWSGDDSDEYKDNRPTAVLVQLQQRNKTTWQWSDVEDGLVELNEANNWKHTWNAPNQSVDANGTVTDYDYRFVEVGYVFGDTTYTIDTSNPNKFATTSEGIYTLSYSKYIDQWNTQYTNELTDGQTITISNSFTPVNYGNITPQKIWAGEDKQEVIDSERPASIVLTLQQKIGSGDWVTMTDSNNNPITVTLDSTNALDGNTNTWQGDAFTNLPEKFVTVVTNENGTTTYKEEYCTYRLIETAYTPNGSASGTAPTDLAGAVSFKTANGKYKISFNADGSGINTMVNVTNTYDESIGVVKEIVDRNGIEFGTSITKDELLTEKSNLSDEEIDRLERLKTIQIGEDLYYVFNWVVSFEGTENKDLNDVIEPLVDKLPDEFSICVDEAVQKANQDGAGTIEGLLAAGNGYFVNPYYLYVQSRFSNPIRNVAEKCTNTTDIWSSNPNYCTGCDYCWNYIFTSTSDQFMFYNPEYTGENLVGFSKPVITQTQPYNLCYSTKIKVEDLIELLESGRYKLENQVNLYEQGTGADLDLGTKAVLNITNNNINLITKNSSNSRIPGVINYTLNINPNGKNLSNGSTIDIEDIFKTAWYLDADYNGGETTYGNDLVDVLMQNIKLYEVDANGVKKELASSDYSILLESGDNVEEGSALLKLTIPDEKYIIVEYTYKLIANENTPSVIHGCKSSTRVNGRYATMAPGLVPPAGDTISFSNKAKLIADSASAESKEVKQDYIVSKSSGTISTNTYPIIEKVNTGGYEVEDSSKAKFLLAKYDNGKWYYASKVDEETNEITWSLTGSEGLTIPENEQLLEILVSEKTQIALQQNVLYKLVEISVPDGYEGSNLGLVGEDDFENMLREYLNYGMTYYNGKDYAVFLNHFVSTHYFVYNSLMTAYPDGITSADVMQVKAGDNIEVPNNELINIGVDKEWINPIGDTTNSKVTVELYWSYEKVSSGYPTEMYLATAEELGIMQEDFSAVKEITVGDTANAELWKDLPNGKNRKPIYYYVKETAYTIGGVKYTYDPDTQQFKSADGVHGVYYPTYVGNAANTDSVIKVNNSYQLMLKKQWVNSANVPMANIPVDKIIVSIYGVNELGEETLLFSNIELSSSNSWTADVTSLITADMNLNEYVSFKAEESAGSSLEEYVISCVFNLNAATGDITVTNKSTAPTEASVTVKKQWSDGNDLHSKQSINVELWRSDIEIDDLDNLSGKLSASGAARLYTEALNASNDWSFTWTGLPLEDENQNKYYYYVLEDIYTVADPDNYIAVVDPDKYSAEYEITDSTASMTEFTVTNTRQAIAIKKLWVDENGNTIEDSDLSAESIEVEIYKKGGPLTDSQDMFQPDGCHPDNAGYATIANQFYNAIDNYYTQNADKLPTDGLNVVAVGDSITYGYKDPDYNENIVSYPSTLDSLLTSKYTTVDVASNATSGLEIDEFWYTDVNSNTDVICLLGGTNDMHQDDGTRGDIKQIYTNLTNLIKILQSSDKAPNAVIFVGTIPYFDFYSDAGVITEGGGWWYNYDSSKHYNTNQTYADACNALIDEYNKYILNIASEYSNVYAVDICSALPIATPDSFVGETTLTKANGWAAAFDITDTDTSAEYYVVETNVPDGWEVEYSPETVKMGTTTPLTITNERNIPDTNIIVEKTWENDQGADDSSRNAISLRLFHSTDRLTWEEADIETAPTITKTDDKWTFTYTNLPAEDNAGNQYYYKVEEDALPGYSVKYGMQITEAVDNGTASTMTLTNTKAISLTLKKEWSDIDTNNHLSDIVKLKLYRTTVPGERPTEGVELILQVPDSVSVGAGNTEPTTIIANKTLTSVKLSDPDGIIDSWSWDNDKTISVTGKSDGTATFEVSDGTSTKTITVKVSSYQMYLKTVDENGGDVLTPIGNDPDNVVTMNLGSTDYSLVVMKKNGETEEDVTSGVTFGGSTNAIGVSTGGVITSSAVGEADITAEIDGFTFTQKFRAILHDDVEFTISATNSGKVAIDSDNLTLTVNNNYGCDVTWTIAEGYEAYAEKVTTDSTNSIKIKGLAVKENIPVTATITYQYVNAEGETVTTSKSATYNVTVENGDIWENDNMTVRVAVGETLKLTSATSMSQFNYNDGSIVQHSVSGNTITLVGVKAGTVQLTVNNSAWNDTATFTVIVYDKFSVSPATKTLEYGGYVDLTPNTTDTVTYTTDDNDLISISGNRVTANSGKEGTATITAKNTVTGESCTITIEVVAELKTISGTLTDEQDTSRTYTYEYDPTLGTITIEFNYDSNSINYHIRDALKADEVLKDLIPIKYQVEVTEGNTNIYARGPGVSWQQFSFNGTIGTVDVSSNTTSFANNNNETGIWQGSNTPITYTIYVKTTSEASVMSLSGYSLNYSDAGETEILADEGIATASISSSGLNFTYIAGDKETEVADVEIQLLNTGGQNWITTIDNLEACDENGNPYYYWVVEEPVFANYDVSYLFNDKDDNQAYMIKADEIDNSAEFDIIVANTKKESEPVEMPSTGGEGTNWYYIVGIMLMLGSAAGLIVLKRRQHSQR